MPKEQRGQPPFEHLARSPTGLWIKSSRTDEKIEIFWQPRFRVEGGNVYLIDANGEVESCVNTAEVQWGDPWRSAGSIALTDDMVAMSGVKDFELFCYGLMRHCVELISHGFGDVPEDVVEWFDEGFGDLNFIVDCSYKIYSPHGEFEDLDNEIINIGHDDDDKLFAEIVVGKSRFEFDLDNPAVLASFIISTTPI